MEENRKPSVGTTSKEKFGSRTPGTRLRTRQHEPETGS